MSKLVIPGRDTGAVRDIFFESEAPLHQSDDAILAASLLARMKTGRHFPRPLHLDPLLASRLDTIQSLAKNWFTEITPTEIDVREEPPKDRPEDPGIGVFFTGGVDSFYTLIENLETITHLVYVHGFDIKLEDTALFRRVKDQIEDIGASLGIQTIFVSTNLRDHLDQYLNWGGEAHGAALAAVGHLLRSTLEKIYIPASFHVESLFPWGSHPDLDPLWSSRAVAFIHHGADARRTEKMGRIAGNPVVRKRLRVCYTNPRGKYNCCRCEKCVRTMLAAEALGELNNMTTFPRKLTKEAVKRIHLTSQASRTFAVENLSLLEERSGRQDLIGALKEIIDRPEAENARYRAKLARRRRIKSRLQWYANKLTG